MSRLDICLITQLHPSMNPRLVKEADALAEAGYRVGVIAPDFSEWAREADREFKDRAWQIVERPTFGPLSPWSVRIPELSMRVLASLATRVIGCTHPGIARAAWHPVAPALVAAAKRHRADLYIAHMVASLPAAAIAASHFRARYAFDAEDFHPGDLPDIPQSARKNRMVDFLERKYLNGCSYITAAAPLIADAYAERYDLRRPTVVLNVFPAGRAPGSWQPSGIALPGPSIYWFSQTIGSGRGIECAIRAIARSKARPHLYLRGRPAQGFLDSISALADAEGVDKQVHILPLGSPCEMERLAGAYDIGYSGEPGGTPNNAIALGNKLFSYLLAGLPMLLSDSPAHRAFGPDLGQSARLFAAGDFEDLARGMDEWLTEPAVLARAREAAWRLGQSRFNWEVEKVKLISSVERAMNRDESRVIQSRSVCGTS